MNRFALVFLAFGCGAWSVWAGPLSGSGAADSSGRAEFILRLDVGELVASFRRTPTKRVYVEQGILLEPGVAYAANSDPATGEILDAVPVEKSEKKVQEGKLKRLGNWAADNAGELTTGGLLAGLIYVLSSESGDSGGDNTITISAGGDVIRGDKIDNSQTPSDSFNQ